MTEIENFLVGNVRVGKVSTLIDCLVKTLEKEPDRLITLPVVGSLADSILSRIPEAIRDKVQVIRT